MGYGCEAVVCITLLKADPLRTMEEYLLWLGHELCRAQQRLFPGQIQPGPSCLPVYSVFSKEDPTAGGGEQC